MIKQDAHIWEATSDSSKYIVVIDRDTCIGAATCVAIAEKVFALDNENKAIVLENDWDDDDVLLAAAQSCPVLAITLKDKITGKVVFPVV